MATIYAFEQYSNTQLCRILRRIREDVEPRISHAVLRTAALEMDSESILLELERRAEAS